MDTMKAMTLGRAVAGWIWPWLLGSALWGQQYKADKAGPPPKELAPGIAQELGKAGFQITANGAAYCEIWLRVSAPASWAASEQHGPLPAVTLTLIREGALVGAMRFDGPGSDRRGQTIQPGVYTLRYGIMPMNDQHQGAAAQRDFLLLTPAAEDRDLNSTPNFDALVAMSRKASHTAHPAVLSFWKGESDSPGFSQKGDSDWVLESSVGDIPIAIIVAGTAAK
jgi:hypothetical protein